MRIVRQASPPAGVRRLFWRLPIRLYRLGFGRLLGRRFMLLEHVGRTTGLPRRAVIEAVERSAGGYVAASGFGTRADWYRNVLAKPDVTIHLDGRTIPVTAAPLSAEEGGEVLARYGPAHRIAAWHLCRIMGFAVDGGVEDYREAGRHIPFVRFTPREKPAPPA
ncbi:MAG: nitroreductase family deazaflavin-dependent oxidoreductase [Streptosporangiales bacterium]|nr:nitroreductase family deazaflavin-dependent oxidoreductase [Streptosporangiales bacterium]